MHATQVSLCVAEERVLGYAYAGVTTSGPLADGRSTSLSMLMEGARKSGVRRSLCRAVLRTLQRQRFHAAFAGITLPNEGTVLSSDNPTVGAVSGLNRALRKH